MMRAFRGTIKDFEAFMGSLEQLFDLPAPPDREGHTQGGSNCFL